MTPTNTMCGKLRLLAGLALTLAGLSAFAQSGPETGADPIAQSAADELRSFARADGAFLAAGLLKANPSKENLASLLQYPGDEVVIVSLTGAQIRQAFERSLSLYPQANPNFLQISGFEVSFSKTAAPGQRVTGVTASGSRIEVNRSYTVAMPSSLGRGGFGYFKIWDKSHIIRTFEGPTLESVMRGKKASDPSPRWVASS